ncbi:MAG: DEAD/DEAH box helicase, partial [Candidatus Tectomicrobia bacterium]|nr:DEAD/DEAH box helicase [Candidatus Tectomicrobia bacterium]
MIRKLIEELKSLPDFAEEILYHRSIPSQPPRHRAPQRPLPAGLETALRQLGIPALYTHQAQALDAVRQGRHIVVVTPTASGKTLTYNLPVLETCQEKEGHHALYLFPLKALAQDQLKSLEELRKAWSAGGPLNVAIYDGDTSLALRKKIRERPPQILITNPDMLHLGILGYHYQWEVFFRGLRYIVVDELHSYRGIFGSHIAQLFRRLRRVCEGYGTRPQFIACSATIANPGEFAETLVGQPFQVIEENGAPRAGGHFLFLNPQASPYTTATRLFTLAVQRGHKTIAFTKARKITELMHTWVLQRSPELAPWVSSYRSGFLPQERREIEAGLAGGRLKGVISTSALEMGIDIGGMEVCLLVGYPGTIMATWQ